MDLENEAVKIYQKYIEEDIDLPVSLAAIKTLIHIIEVSKAETMQGLDGDLNIVINHLKANKVSLDSVTSFTSGCELLKRTITLKANEALLSKDFSVTKQVLVEGGLLFLNNAINAKYKIAQLSQQFIKDGSVILTHASSKVVIQLLIEASLQNKRFTVFCTETMPNKQGWKTYNILKNNGISCMVILDSAVGYIMERVNMVLLGAENVVESGGIINKVGSFQLAVVAKAMNKPVYVAAESFKFARVYPLKQKDISNIFKYKSNEDGHPMTDYTPPSYITLLFTDLGILTPSAVSDELIKLYM
ncbi:translation initiation factor eIF2B subunit alpha [Hydra vulgaris]|nr:translation initiation factor eIF-2B subunit alpha-like [Hydra vulgaris]